MQPHAMQPHAMQPHSMPYLYPPTGYRPPRPPPIAPPLNPHMNYYEPMPMQMPMRPPMRQFRPFFRGRPPHPMYRGSFRQPYPPRNFKRGPWFSLNHFFHWKTANLQNETILQNFRTENPFSAFVFFLLHILRKTFFWQIKMNVACKLKWVVNFEAFFLFSNIELYLTFINVYWKIIATNEWRRKLMIF